MQQRPERSVHRPMMRSVESFPLDEVQKKIAAGWEKKKVRGRKMLVNMNDVLYPAKKGKYGRTI